MVPAPTYQNLPTFGTGASLVQPIAGTYNGGFLPGQLFPAEYENWLMNYITANSNTSQISVVNLVAEMGTVLAAASITPSAGLTNQLYAALNALYATVGALSTESSTRASADTTLQTNINNEASTRSSADSNLQNQVNGKAPIASPTFTGTVVVPIASGNTSPPQKIYVDSGLNGKASTLNGSTGSGAFVTIIDDSGAAHPNAHSWIVSAEDTGGNLLVCIVKTSTNQLTNLIGASALIQVTGGLIQVRALSGTCFWSYTQVGI